MQFRVSCCWHGCLPLVYKEIQLTWQRRSIYCIPYCLVRDDTQSDRPPRNDSKANYRLGTYTRRNKCSAEKLSVVPSWAISPFHDSWAEIYGARAPTSEILWRRVRKGRWGKFPVVFRSCSTHSRISYFAVELRVLRSIRKVSHFILSQHALTDAIQRFDLILSSNE